MTDVSHRLGFLRGLQEALRSCYKHGIEPGHPHWDNLRRKIKEEVTMILALLKGETRPSAHRNDHHMWCNHSRRPLPCEMCDGLWIECPYEDGEKGPDVMARYFPANKVVE